MLRGSLNSMVQWLILVLLIPPASAFWIISHGTLTRDRLDPIVSPGEVSSHVHTVVGASNFGPTLSTSSLQASNCTTSQAQADKSYWAPQLYHVNENNTYTLIPISYVNTYYLQRDGTTSKTQAFPAGLRMLAGDMYRTTYNDSNVADKAVSFVCLDYSGNSSQSNEFPTKNCPDGLRAQIVFPSCWDGHNLDSEDHQQHMSYPTGGQPDNGDCPSNYPVKVITMLHEWIFSVGDFDFNSGKNNWVFSFGDELGYGFHADFVNGWTQDVLEAAVTQCTSDLFDNLAGCPPFVASIDKNAASSCSIPSKVDEPILGPLQRLPGCNPVPMSQNESQSTPAQCPGLATPAIEGGSGTADATSVTNSSASINAPAVPSNSTGII